MKRVQIGVLSLFILFFFSCKPTEIIRGIEITETFPNITEKGKVTGYDTLSDQLYYYKNQRVLQRPYHLTTDTSDGIAQMYMVYNKGDSIGKLYAHRKKVGLVSVDSVLKQTWIAHLNFYTTFQNNLLTLLSSNKLGKDSLCEVYKVVNKNDSAQTGTISLCYNKKLLWADYSLTAKLDSMKKMKLCKVNTVDDAHWIKGYDFFLERVDLEYTLKEIPVSNTVRKFFTISKK